MVLSTHPNGMDSSMNNQVFCTRQNLKLDLLNTSKKNKASAESCAITLSSPDISKFNLSTPDILKLTENFKTPTGTPVTKVFDTFSTTLSSAPKISQLPADSIESNRMDTYDSDELVSIDKLPGGGLMPIKEEPQIVPSSMDSPSLSPINLESQEEEKLKRKRLRNRLAASKCRKRKLEKIALLEDNVKKLKNENHSLENERNKLKQEVYMMKQKIIKHHNNGCKINDIQ